MPFFLLLFIWLALWNASRCRLGVVSRLFQQREGRYFNIFHFVRPATVNHDQPPYEIHYAQPITILFGRKPKNESVDVNFGVCSRFFLFCVVYSCILYSLSVLLLLMFQTKKNIKKSKTKQEWDWMQFAHNDRNSVSNAAAIQNRKLRLNKQTKK